MKTIALAILLAGAAAATPKPRPVAMMLESCAPAGGGAIRLTVARSGEACAASVRDTLTFSLFRSEPKDGAKLELDGTNGNASRCPKPGACELAQKASITFSHYEAGAPASGHWSATFKDGVEEGDFSGAV